MKKQIDTLHQIDANASALWEIIRTGEKVESWFPIFTGSKVENGKRYCSMNEGELEETILLSDDATMTFRYSIDKQQMFPASQIVGTMRVVERGESKAYLHWSVEMEVDSEEDFKVLESETRKLYELAADGLRNLTK